MFKFPLLASCLNNINHCLIVLLHSSLYGLWYNNNMLVVVCGSVWHLKANLSGDGLQFCCVKILVKFLPYIRDLTWGGHSIFFFLFLLLVCFWSKCFLFSFWTTCLPLLVLLLHYHVELTSKNRTLKWIRNSRCMKWQTKANTASCLAWSIKLFLYVRWRVTQIKFGSGIEMNSLRWP